MYNALQVANYILSKQDEEAGDLISNLKLQKLLYYAQGYHLAIYGKPLFKDKIAAWKHGPVVLNVYHHFKECGEGAIPLPREITTFDAEVNKFLDEIYKVFGQFSAWKLRNMTHDEPPWSETKQSEFITNESLKTYFKTQVA